MRMCWSVLLAAFACFLAVADADDLDDLKRFISDLNKYIAEKGLQVVRTEDFEAHWGSLKLDFTDGSVTNFASLQLSGNDQNINSTDYKLFTIIHYDLNLRFRELGFFNRYAWRMLFFRGSGKSYVKLNDEDIRVKGKINLGKNKSCEAEIETMSIGNLGSFDIRFRSDHGNTFPVLLGNLIEIALNKMKPKYKIMIHNEILKRMKKILGDSKFSKIVCETLRK